MKKRPINLDLFSVRFPITAIVSILHRISGVFLFFIIPVLLLSLQSSLSETDWASWQNIRQGFVFKSVIWLILSAFFYHLLAGLRHLFMDMGWGESLSVARLSASAVLLLSVIYSLMLGICLWF